MTGVAVVGAGAWGANHIRIWRELGCLRAVCDPDSVRLDAIRAMDASVDVSRDFSSILRRADISAVVIAAPAPTHASLAYRALAAGKDVLVEKPMALTVAEGERLVEAAARGSRVLMVGHVLEYHPAITALRDLLADPAFGHVRYLYSNRLNLGRIRRDESALWSFAPHDVAIMLRFMGPTVREVASRGQAYLSQGVADVTLTHLTFDGGVTGHIFVSWLHPVKEQRFVVVGEHQMAVFDDTLPWADKLRRYPHRVDVTDTQVPVAHRAEAIAVALPAIEPLRAECEHFLACVRGRQDPLTGGENGLRVLRVLEAAQASLESGGRPVHVRLDDAVARR